MKGTEQGGPAAAVEPAGSDRIRCLGAWTVEGIAPLRKALATLPRPQGEAVVLDGGSITAMDTAGAWLLHRIRQHLTEEGRRVAVEGLSESHRSLLELVAGFAEAVTVRPPHRAGGFSGVGERVVHGCEGLVCFLSFAGRTFERLGVSFLNPWRIRWAEVLGDLYASGVQALGIIGLLSFLMGVVIAYQGAVQLQVYGANIYVADLVGLSMLRELAPLLTAIIIAGRTGSAYTAKIGTMQVREEVAALQTIGIPPLDMLVVPRFLSLLIALPLLAVFADMMSVLGGMLMAKLQLGLGFAPFLDRFAEAVSARAFFLGLIKTPVFAAIIALIGCFQGFRVAGSADSVGRHTTISVVQSIFLVIVADAQFSILFSWLNI